MLKYTYFIYLLSIINRITHNIQHSITSMISVIIGTMMGLTVGALFTYILTKRQKGEIVGLNALILYVSTLVGAVTGACNDFGLRPLFYTVPGALISFVMCYIICLNYGVNKLHTCKYPHSDADVINFLSTLTGTTISFLYGVYVSM